MIDVKIENFDIKYLLDIIDCWNDTLLYDSISKQRFINVVLLDDNFDEKLFKIAIKNDKVVGFCYGIRRRIPYLERGLEENRGWISIMAVNASYQRFGIGTRLIKEVMHTLHEMGCMDITLCAYSPNYFTPGIDIRYQNALAFVKSLGFSVDGQAVSMYRDLWEYTLKKEYVDKLQILNDKGIHIQAYDESYLQALLTFTLAHFGAGWKRNVLLALRQQEGEDTILLCVNEKREILGFCMRKIDGNEGRFGPFGVRVDMRSHGIGSILYECMMQDMRKRGIYHSYFLWTSGDAQRFYERHQTHVSRSYNLYRKVFTI